MKKILILFSIFYFLFSPVALGAELYFGAHSKEVGVEKNFEIGVFVNTEGELVNAIEGEVIFPPDLEFVEIRDGNSILNLWIKRPQLKEAGQVSFAGVIPGGYFGGRGYLFSLILQSESVKDYFNFSIEILGDYEFERPSYQKISEYLKSFFKNNENFDSKIFAKTLPKEIINIFDTCFILPLPKFQDSKKYTQELGKVARESKVLYLKNKIREIAQAINKKEKEKEETQSLQKELSGLVKLLKN